MRNRRGQLDRIAYSPGELAEMFGASRWGVRMAIKRGDLRAFRVGRRLFVAVSELQRFLHKATI
jgi:excisionase family DNA binding protein